MGGRKSDLIVTGAKEPRQRIWESIRMLAPGFSLNDIARRSGQLPYEIERYISALAKAGIVRQVSAPKKNVEGVYALVSDEGAEHPRLNSKGERTHAHLATENIWRTLRILGGDVTAEDVTQTASAGAVSLTVIKTRQYLNALVEAGYLVKTEHGSRAPDTYRMAPGKNTGPRPPEIRKLDSLQVYDPNLSKLVYAKTTGSVNADRSLVEPGIALLRSRDLLKEWLDQVNECKAAFSPTADLVQRTRLELASPDDSGGLQ